MGSTRSYHLLNGGDAEGSFSSHRRTRSDFQPPPSSTQSMNQQTSGIQFTRSRTVNTNNGSSTTGLKMASQQETSHY